MTQTPLTVSYTPEAGLTVTWTGCDSPHPFPVRAYMSGHGKFMVWGNIDSGEGEPLWAEPNLDLILFGSAVEAPGTAVTVEPLGAYGARVTAVGERAAATLLLRLDGDSLTAEITVANPQGPGGRSLPLCHLELRFADLPLSPSAYYLSAHPYGGGTFGYGAISELTGTGVSFVHGCIGQALPLVYLHHPETDRGIACEFLLDQRPVAWLRPGGSWCLTWSPDRLLEPGQTHSIGGAARFTPYSGRPVAQMRQWRDRVAEVAGFASPFTPEWLRKATIIEFNMNPDNSAKDFLRLDDPRCRHMLERWKAMGYTAIFAVSDNHVGQNWLSPVDYAPCKAIGGRDAEAQMLAWAHELGFHLFFWITTVGIDRDAPEVREHPEWFTHRPNGDLFYAWESGAQNAYVGYAPDADALAAGWRQWLKDQVRDVINRGYDGIFVDGCIPRASNHLRWGWPGEGRNAVEDQVRDLAAYVRTLGENLITFVEDESLVMQTTSEMTMGRYHEMPPYLKKAYWDHGMGGGPEVRMAPPARIAPEMAREYLLVRHASLLAGGVSNDIVEGYMAEQTRPWVAQSLLSGIVPKTHSQYVDFPEVFRPINGLSAADVPAHERTPAHRRRGHEEFLRLLRFSKDEPLVRDAPLSIEGVIIDGDAAVVGLLRPGADRSLLSLIQFADRPATVTVRLADPVDLPAADRARAGRPDQQTWLARECLRSIVNDHPAADGALSASTGLTVALGAYGYRVFELIRR